MLNKCILYVFFITLCVFSHAYSATVTWNNSSGDGLWSTDSNWSGGVKPSTNDVVIFDATSTANCLIDVALNVGSISLQVGYTGTLTQGTSQSIVLSSSNGFSVADGAFVGGSASIDCNGALSITGGSFTSTNDDLMVANNVTVSGATFLHNNGTLLLDGVGKTLDVGTSTFNNVIIAQNQTGSVSVNGVCTVANDLTINSVGTIQTGTITVAGNVTTTDTSVGGSGFIEINGIDAQVLSAGGGTGALPNVKINKAGGTLSISDTIEIDSTSGWIHIAGSVDATTSTIRFTITTVVDAAAMAFHNVVIDMFGSNSVNVVGSMDINNDLTILSGGTLNNGTIKVAGNVTTHDMSLGGSAVIEFDGTGAQLLSANNSAGALPNVHINKTAGVLTIVDTIEIDSTTGWTHTAGAVDGSTSTVLFNISTSVDAAGMAFNDVIIDMAGSNNLNIVDTVHIGGDLTIVSGGTVLNGTLKVGGDICSLDASIAGTAVIEVMGTGAQLLHASGGVGAIPNIIINKTSGLLTIADTIHVDGTTGWTHTAGQVDAGTSTVLFDITTTVDAAQMSFNNVEFDMAYSNSLNVVEALHIDNDLTISSIGTINNGTVYVGGDFTSLDTTVSGSSVIEINGVANQLMSANGGTGGFPHITVNKPSGTLTIQDAFDTIGNWTHLAGAVNPGTSTISFVGNTYVTITGATLGNIVIDKSYDSRDVSLLGSVNTFHTINILKGDLLGNVSTINISGDFLCDFIDGSFEAGTSSVVFNGADQSITGSFSFYNFEKHSDNVASTLTLEEGQTQAITNYLAFKGNSSSILNLVSSTPGTLWGLSVDPAAIQNIRYVNVQDSDARYGATIAGFYNVSDLGNNFNWDFADSLTVITSDLSSYTSPAWFEGTTSRHAESLTASVNGAESINGIRLSPTSFTFDNASTAGLMGITLDQTQPTNVEMQATVRNKNYNNSVAVTWEPIDLSAYGMDTITLRTGDSIMLTATGVGTTLEIDTDGNGTFDFSGSPGDSVVVTYHAFGTHVVTSKIDGVALNDFTVHAISVTPTEAAPAAKFDFLRQVPIQIDAPVAAPIIDVQTAGVVESGNLVSQTGTGYNHVYDLKIKNGGSGYYVVPRLSTGQGFYALPVSGFTLTTTSYQDIIASVAPSGEYIFDFNTVMTPHLADIDVKYNTTSGATFVNSSNIMWVNTDNFTQQSDGTSSYYYQIIRDAAQPGTCHQRTPYQHGFVCGN